jgi:hypothetical protein
LLCVDDLRGMNLKYSRCSREGFHRTVECEFTVNIDA